MSEDRLTHLEEKLAYQEASIQSLSDTVYRQDQQLDQLRQELIALKDRLEDVRSGQGESSDEEIPPHY